MKKFKFLLSGLNMTLRGILFLSSSLASSLAVTSFFQVRERKDEGRGRRKKDGEKKKNEILSTKNQHQYMCS